MTQDKLACPTFLQRHDKGPLSAFISHTPEGFFWGDGVEAGGMMVECGLLLHLTWVDGGFR